MRDETPAVSIARARPAPVQQRGALACLILASGDDAGRTFDLVPGSSVIGRAADAAVRIDGPGVSRRHAAVDVVAAGAVLRDLASANGTWLNDVRVETSAALHDGDTVRAGACMLRFHAGASFEAALHDRMQRSAQIDDATGVHNRRHLLQALQREMQAARTSGAPLALLCFALDGDAAAGGDEALRNVAGLLNAALQGPGFVFARSGDTGFCALLPRLASAQATAFAEAACRAVADADADDTVSAGVAGFVPTMTQPAELIAAADRALYAARNGGRNQVVAA